MDYKKEMEKIGIEKNQYPYFNNPEDFASRFKRCTIYEYGNITYSDSSNSVINQQNRDK